MGCIFSRSNVIITSDLQSTQLTPSELSRLHKLFRSLTTKKKEFVDYETILAAWSLADNALCRLMISLYGRYDRSRRVDFTQFVILLWHIGILSRYSMGFFLLDYFDSSGVGILEAEAVSKCLKALKIPEIRINVALNDTPAANVYDQRERSFDIDEWEHFCIRNVPFFAALIECQHKFQQNCLGIEFWEMIQRRKFFSGKIAGSPTLQEYMDANIKQYVTENIRKHRRWPCLTIGVMMDGYQLHAPQCKSEKKSEHSGFTSLHSSSGARVVPVNSDDGAALSLVDKVDSKHVKSDHKSSHQTTGSPPVKPRSRPVSSHSESASSATQSPETRARKNSSEFNSPSSHQTPDRPSSAVVKNLLDHDGEESHHASDSRHAGDSAPVHSHNYHAALAERTAAEHYFTKEQSIGYALAMSSGQPAVKRRTLPPLSGSPPVPHSRQRRHSMESSPVGTTHQSNHASPSDRPGIPAIKSNLGGSIHAQSDSLNNAPPAAQATKPSPRAELKESPERKGKRRKSL